MDENGQRPERLVKAEPLLQGSTLRYREDDLLELSPDEMVPLNRLLKKHPLTLVHFWATWCPPCIAELPYIDALWQEYSDHPSVGFLIIAVDGDPQDARDYVGDHGYHFPVYADPNKFALASSVPNVPPKEVSVPVTLVVTRDGRVSKAFLGPLTQRSAVFIETVLSDRPVK